MSSIVYLIDKHGRHGKVRSRESSKSYFYVCTYEEEKSSHLNK